MLSKVEKERTNHKQRQKYNQQIISQTDKRHGWALVSLGPRKSTATYSIEIVGFAQNKEDTEQIKASEMESHFTFDLHTSMVP